MIVLTIPEMGFYAEVDKKAAIQQVIQDIKNHPKHTIDSDALVYFLNKRGLNLGDLTMDEINSIIRGIK